MYSVSRDVYHVFKYVSEGIMWTGIIEVLCFLLVVQMWITICLNLLADNVCLWIDFFNNCLNLPPDIYFKIISEVLHKGVGVAGVSGLSQP